MAEATRSRPVRLSRSRPKNSAVSVPVWLAEVPVASASVGRLSSTSRNPIPLAIRLTKSPNGWVWTVAPASTIE